MGVAVVVVYDVCVYVNVRGKRLCLSVIFFFWGPYVCISFVVMMMSSWRSAVDMVWLNTTCDVIPM